MPRKYIIEPVRTYASHENVDKAVAKAFGDKLPNIRYFIMTHSDGRFFPVFIGTQAVDAGIHFSFNVIA